MKVVWSQWALERTEEIYDDLLVAASESFADRIMEQIQQGIALLKQYAKAGQLEPWLEYKELSHRRLVIGNYKVIYRIVGDEIRITDVFETHQDPGKMKS